MARDSPALQLDPSGERPLKVAKELRRRVLRDSGRRNVGKLRDRRRTSTSACPIARSSFWTRIPNRLPWRAPESAAPSPRALVSGDR